MEKMMVFDDQMKRKLGVMCFVPVFCFLATLVYYIILILPLTHGHVVPASIVGITSRNYDTLFAMLAVSGTITAAVFITCLVIIARLKSLNSAQKMMWVIFLSIIAPVASAFFWIFLIKDSPKYVPSYPEVG